MENIILSNEIIEEFRQSLLLEEKSTATIEKYTRDTRAFFNYTKEEIITKEMVINYKQYLIDQKYKIKSINSMIVSVNHLLSYLRLNECKVKSIRIQKQIYCTEDKELTKDEYYRLLKASQKKPKLKLIMETICSTGIRISELKYFTIDAIQKGEINVYCKAKIRSILIPKKLQKLLLKYAKQNHIESGQVFVTRNGTPVNRSNIWQQMKKLCKEANVQESKVFPHNLRKLFARTFYNIEKDIAKLADILGHSTIETTRIYIMSTGTEHRKKIEQLRLVV
ncbi:tyrosine-type recombinase/integrase [Floccifex sp.]|uniref:tyrosine-type recombinase/integrase n=1 Tax=Floccifex sp. TaxID=2815810 RepID=UPI002A760236|nr:tyrosine-type recombinase/integrase [Floccifex sp.]MDD7281179.1 tyrosine-type recombinase/integrase [Erysipelotrichaceae bacterium]MDY2958697.1 tyrosine-type recombinase/integrase [Floccifex sp.]